MAPLPEEGDIVGWSRARRALSQLDNETYLFLCPLSVSHLSLVLRPWLSQGCCTRRYKMLTCCGGSTVFAASEVLVFQSTAGKTIHTLGGKNF